jgi:hypothetical protein
MPEGAVAAVTAKCVSRRRHVISAVQYGRERANEGGSCRGKVGREVRGEVECGAVTMSERGDVEGDVIGVISQGADDGDPLVK